MTRQAETSTQRACLLIWRKEMLATASPVANSAKHAAFSSTPAIQGTQEMFTVIILFTWVSVVQFTTEEERGFSPSRFR